MTLFDNSFHNVDPNKIFFFLWRVYAVFKLYCSALSCSKINLKHKIPPESDAKQVMYFLVAFQQHWNKKESKKVKLEVTTFKRYLIFMSTNNSKESFRFWGRYIGLESFSSTIDYTACKTSVLAGTQCSLHKSTLSNLKLKSSFERIIDSKSQNTNHRLGWVGRDLKSLLVPAPAMGRDAFH